MVCYESIFPDEIADRINSETLRPGVLLNVTNDGWFGATPGPYQHFAQARLRAIEQGLPLIRSANTGISAIVDPFGRTLASAPLGSRGRHRRFFAPIAPADTFFALPARHPDHLVDFCSDRQLHSVDAAFDFRLSRVAEY